MVGETPAHIPVLPREVCELLDPRPGDVVLDATVGMGGHARLLGERIGETGTLIGLDVDPGNLDVVRARLADGRCRVELRRANFADLHGILNAIGIAKLDILFADLGVSSSQLDDATRGFSFQHDGPLDMRMDARLTVTAASIVNGLKERELSDLLFRNAQERASRRIARRICTVRRDSRITTTGQLAQIVADAVGADPVSRKAKIHPATRTFLALRMTVNDEIASLEALLTTAPNVLKPGGRLGIIAFHSVEDRPVKLDFRKQKAEGIYRIVTKKPIVASAEERRSNPRSRSAKMRVAVRLPEN